MIFEQILERKNYTGEVGDGEPLETPFGRAKVDNGYYRITTSKEGYPLRLLHVLVWENFYGIKKPDGFDIHHINGDKLDNRIQNLQLLDSGVHKSYHNKGENNPMYSKKHNEETRKKMSIAKKGENNPMYSKKHNEETRKKMSIAKKGENNPMYGKTGENHPAWKDYARVVNAGKNSTGKQRYALIYNGKILKKSIHREKLEKIAERINNTMKKLNRVLTDSEVEKIIKGEDIE